MSPEIPDLLNRIETLAAALLAAETRLDALENHIQVLQAILIKEAEDDGYELVFDPEASTLSEIRAVKRLIEETLPDDVIERQSLVRRLESLQSKLAKYKELRPKISGKVPTS